MILPHTVTNLFVQAVGHPMSSQLDEYNSLGGDWPLGQALPKLLSLALPCACSHSLGQVSPSLYTYPSVSRPCCSLPGKHQHSRCLTGTSFLSCMCACVCPG